MYRRYGEARLRRYFTPKLSFLLFMVMVVVLFATNAQVTFYVRNMNMKGLACFWAPMVTPVAAIVFFLGIAYWIAPLLSERSALVVIGRNTRYIVYYHQMLFALLSYGVAVLARLTDGAGILGELSISRMQTYQYYAGEEIPQLAVMITTLSILIPLAVCIPLSRIKNVFLRMGAYLLLTGLIVLYLFGVSQVLPAV